MNSFHDSVKLKIPAEINPNPGTASGKVSRRRICIRVAPSTQRLSRHLVGEGFGMPSKPVRRHQEGRNHRIAPGGVERPKLNHDGGRGMTIDGGNQIRHINWHFHYGLPLKRRALSTHRRPSCSRTSSEVARSPPTSSHQSQCDKAGSRILCLMCACGREIQTGLWGPL